MTQKQMAEMEDQDQERRVHPLMTVIRFTPIHMMIVILLVGLTVSTSLLWAKLSDTLNMANSYYEDSQRHLQRSVELLDVLSDERVAHVQTQQQAMYFAGIAQEEISKLADIDPEQIKEFLSAQKSMMLEIRCAQALNHLSLMGDSRAWEQVPECREARAHLLESDPIVEGPPLD